MSYCVNCGQQMSEEAKFCSSCGAPIVGNSSNTHRKKVFEGELHKCPNCGGMVEAFTTNCPSCGLEFRGSKASNSVHDLATKLEEIENNRQPKKSRTLKDEFFGTYGKFTLEDEKKIALIRNFVIPNTKEDILEFMILASSNIDMKLYGTEPSADETGAQRAISDAWIAKFEQAYQKAQFTFSDTAIFSKIEKIYLEKIKELNKQKRKKARQLPLLFGMMFALVIISLIALWIVQ